MSGLINRLRGFDAKHYATTEQYARQIERLYEAAARELAATANGATYDPNKVYSFNDLPQTRKEAQAILSRLVGKIQHVVEGGTTSEWLQATYKNDAFLGAILRTTKLTKEEAEQYQDRNLEALRSFQNRKVAGLGLSDRVWSYAGNFLNEVELGIDVALGEGTPAEALARQLRQQLKDPEQIFRRFRYRSGTDEEGNPVYAKKWKRRVFDASTGKFTWVDDNPANYHPGQGVYRSSVKNSMRLARTEINMAYREAEYLRWQQLDFVVGFRVCLSNNHTTTDGKGKRIPLTDVCDELAGDYPKTFKFVGWHPQCRCYVVPIMKDYEEYNEDRANRFKAIARKQEYKSLPSRRTVTDVPKNFRDYIDKIADRAKGWKSQPYYIRDNFVGGSISGGLKAEIPTKTMNGIQPCTDYDSEIAGLKAWSFATGLDLSAIEPLRTAGNKAALGAEVKRLQQVWQQRTDEWQKAYEGLFNYLYNGEGKLYPKIVEGFKKELADNKITTTIYYKDGISKLSQALIEAKAAIQAAKASESSSKNMPDEFKIGGKFTTEYGYTEYSKEFFDLLKEAPKLELKFSNGGSYETDMGKTVRIDSHKRIKLSQWYRHSLIYHEFGHAIGDQRRIIDPFTCGTVETELSKLRADQITRLRKREKAVIIKTEREYDFKTGTYNEVKKRVEVNQMRAKTISEKLDIVYHKIHKKPDSDPIFTRFGLSKWDIEEQIGSVQDTLKSLITSVGWGHTTAYFKSESHRQHEYLAHCFENRFIGNRVFQLYLPDIYAEMVAFINTLKNP